MQEKTGIRFAGVSLGVFVFLIAGAIQQAHATPSCTPTVEGPIAVTASSRIYDPSSNPYAGATPPAGEMEEEFFVSCNVSVGHYKTVIHVTLPTDPAKQSGIVVAEPWHPGDFWTIYDKARKYITRSGAVSVVIVGNPYILDTYFKKAEPARYAGLSLPGKGARSLANTPPAETAEPEVLGQVGALIKSGGIPGVKARKVVLGGMSTTGWVVRNYIAYEHAAPGAKSVYDGYFPEQAANPKGPLPDLDVPVVEIQGERELIGELRGTGPVKYARADGPLYRLFEVPGSPHIATRMATQLPGQPVPTNRIEPGTPECVGHTWTDFPTDMLFAVGLDSLVKWTDKGIAPPHVPRIAMVPKAREIKRDQFGNAMGGLRTSYLDVPINTYHATWGNYVTLPDGKPSDPMAATCGLTGWIKPLPKETLKKLYPSHADYVAKVDKDTASLVRQRLLLPEDAAALRAEARQAEVP